MDTRVLESVEGYSTDGKGCVFHGNIPIHRHITHGDLGCYPARLIAGNRLLYFPQVAPSQTAEGEFCLQTWINAAIQNFNSVGIAFGSMMTFASYNRRDSNIFRSVLSICLVNAATSIIAGFAVFSILGHIAMNQGQEVEDVVTQGPGLVFIVYPEAFSAMPAGLAQVASILFFVMLICLAIDSQFASVEVLVTAIEDSFGKRTAKYRKELLVLIVCAVCFLLGLPYITNGGIYYFKLVDYYSSGLSNMLVAFFEAVAVVWCYGALRLVSHTGQMTGSVSRRILHWYFVPCWYVIAPIFITAVMIFNWMQYRPVTYGNYSFPRYTEAIGWGITGLSVICLPLGMIKGVFDAPGGSICEKIKHSLKPQMEENRYDVKMQMSTEKDHLPPELSALFDGSF